MKITLTWFEQFLASQVGLMRHTLAVRSRRLDGAGLVKRGGEGAALHIEGAMGELAYAKATNRFWGGSVDTFKGGDVGRVQVRTRSRPTYELLVRPQDPDDDVYVLVRGAAGEYEIVGSIVGREAKRAEWRQTYGGRDAAYFVPDSALTSIGELID